MIVKGESWGPLPTDKLLLIEAIKTPIPNDLHLVLLLMQLQISQNKCYEKNKQLHKTKI